MLLLIGGLFTGTTCAASDLEQHFRAGQAAMQSGNAAAAVKEFQAVLAIDPTLVEARVNLGLAYHLAGEYRHAVDQLILARKARPDIAGANIVLGNDYLKLGEPEKAVAPLEGVLKADPNNWQAAKLLREAFVNSDDYRQATLFARKVFQQAGGASAESWYALGETYLDMSKRLGVRLNSQFSHTAWNERLTGDIYFDKPALLPTVLKRYRAAVADSGNVSGFHWRLGFALLRDGKPSEAVQEFQSELKIDPASVETRFGLAAVAIQKRQINDALHELGLAIDSGDPLGREDLDWLAKVLPGDWVKSVDAATLPDSPAGLLLRAAVYQAHDQVAKATDKFAAIPLAPRAKPSDHECQIHPGSSCIPLLEKRPSTGLNRILLGQAYFHAGEYEKAAETFSAGFRPRAPEPQAMYWLIQTYLALSEDCFQRLLTNHSDSWLTYKLRAEYDEVRENRPDAIKNYKLAIERKPDDAVLHAALASQYLDSKAVAEGEAEVRKSLELNPDSAQTLLLAGRLSEAQDRTDDAIRFLKKAIAIQPNFAEAHAELGRALFRSGDWAGAAAELEAGSATDVYGDLHYLLFRAEQKLGSADRAQKALARSQQLRRAKLSSDMERVKAGTAY
ncbi:MAG TPA: tetratricopeptide repeat protein [Bryobacteraceae bacterium]|nr:tetratricopeptide repeat protein [Bryobacteraceae bacterium]